MSDAAHDYAQTVAAFAARLDEELPAGDPSPLTREVWQRCAEVGLCAVTVDTGLGGQGADALTAALAFEAFGENCRDHGLAFSLGAHLWSAVTPIARFGSDEQRRRLLPGLCDGSLIGVQAMSEADAGSDAMAMTTTAVADGDGWILEGSKAWVTNAPVADIFVVFATSDPALGWAGVSAFVVERDRPGVTVSAAFSKMGLTSSPMAELRLEECRVPADALLSTAGGGMAVFNHSMRWERALICAPALGAMRRQLDDACEYARNRRQFGSAIAGFQAVSHRLVDMRVRLDAARLLLLDVARRIDEGERLSAEIPIVKLVVSEAWVANSLAAQQVYGAFGFMAGPVEQAVRDAIASRIYSGTSDMQRNLVAAAMRLR